MLLGRIHLRKLLMLFGADRATVIGELREDIRQTIAREQGRASTGGGDFHAPFWTDAKLHVAGECDLNTSVANRVGRNERRARLYPLLAEGFLQWWDDRRRWNEPFDFYDQSVKARYQVEGTPTEVKVESLLALRVGQGSRLYYAYFCEEPALSDETAGLGLWVMRNALQAYDPDDLRLLDILRSRSYSIGDVPQRGDEEARVPCPLRRFSG